MLFFDAISTGIYYIPYTLYSHFLLATCYFSHPPLPSPNPPYPVIQEVQSDIFDASPMEWKDGVWTAKRFAHSPTRPLTHPPILSISLNPDPIYRPPIYLSVLTNHSLFTPRYIIALCLIKLLLTTSLLSHTYPLFSYMPTPLLRSAPLQDHP